MKKLMLAVCLMFGGATLVSAQQDQTPTQTQSQEDQGQQISVSELPDAVTAKLESQDYSGWTVGNVYKKMDDSNQEMYVVELKQGTETKKVKFDRDGNQIEKDKHGKSENYRDDSQLDETQSPESDETQSDETQSPDQSSETQSTEQSTEQADNSSTEQQ